jgi:hypothetical protein
VGSSTLMTQRGLAVAAMLLMPLLLMDCAGSRVGDAIAGPEKLAQQDDAYCRSIGANVGTPAYTQCRMFATERRDHAHEASAERLAAAGRALQNIDPPPVPTPAPALVLPRPTDCTSTRTGYIVQTHCN